MSYLTEALIEDLDRHLEAAKARRIELDTTLKLQEQYLRSVRMLSMEWWRAWRDLKRSRRLWAETWARQTRLEHQIERAHARMIRRETEAEIA